jgi:GGDEF domain-containing protein
VVAFVDVVGQKAVNDAHGHAAGDAVLRRVGHGIRRLHQSSGLSSRGGAELAPKTVNDALGTLVVCLALMG